MNVTVRKLEVRLEHTPRDIEVVGHLLDHERTIYFEYDPDFAARLAAVESEALPGSITPLQAKTRSRARR